MTIALDILRKHRDELGEALAKISMGLNISRLQAATKHNLLKRLISEIEAAEKGKDDAQGT